MEQEGFWERWGAGGGGASSRTGLSQQYAALSQPLDPAGADEPCLTLTLTPTLSLTLTLTLPLTLTLTQTLTLTPTLTLTRCQRAVPRRRPPRSP